jgi:hypothetical protein
MFDWALVWDLILLDMCTNWGLLLLLPLDVLVLFTSWLVRKKGDVPALQSWEAVLSAVHLVLGGAAVWFNNDVAYNIVTFACWGPIIGIWWANSRKKKQTADSADEEVQATDGWKGAPEPKALDEEESVSEQGEEETSQEEPPEGKRERRGRLRRS